MINGSNYRYINTRICSTFDFMLIHRIRVYCTPARVHIDLSGDNKLTTEVELNDTFLLD